MCKWIINSKFWNSVQHSTLHLNKKEGDLCPESQKFRYLNIHKYNISYLISFNSSNFFINKCQLFCSLRIINIEWWIFSSNFILQQQRNQAYTKKKKQCMDMDQNNIQINLIHITSTMCLYQIRPHKVIHLNHYYHTALVFPNIKS